MATYEEMYEKILCTGQEDDRIRAVTMEGSGVSAGGEYEDMWNKLFLMYDYFEELSVYVADRLEFTLDMEESKAVREFMEDRRRK